MNRPPKIFYCAWTAPSTASGACLAMRRHFVERHDFDTFIFTNERFFDDTIPLHIVRRPAWLERAMRTRFRRPVRQFEMLLMGRWWLSTALKFAREFQPDVIFTIPDNDFSWCAYLLAKKLGVPLVTNFQDWWPQNQYWAETERPYGWTRRILENRFRRMYAASAVAFCTSDGMQEFLGPHPRAITLLPCPGQSPENIPPADFPGSARRTKIIYAGTVSGDYGRMVLALAKILADEIPFEFLVYGPPPDWPAEEIRWAREQGIFHGFIPHDQLRKVLASADVFLTVMSFNKKQEIMSRVSFTTKFLEYTQYGRPVIVWGPEYCQPVRVARAHDAGLPVTAPAAGAVLAGLRQLLDAAVYTRLTEGAKRAAATFFSPENIHAKFKEGILAAAGK
jgi:glycosyltransferase involved in cell wall biosynthesis